MHFGRLMLEQPAILSWCVIYLATLLRLLSCINSPALWTLELLLPVREKEREIDVQGFSQPSSLIKYRRGNKVERSGSQDKSETIVIWVCKN